MSTEISPSKSLTQRQQEWLGHLRSWRHQGGSLKVYAQTHGLSLSGLYTAKRFLTQRGVWRGQPSKAPDPQAPTLVPVRLTSGPSASSMFRVVLPNGVVVEVPEHADLALFRALLGCVAESLR